MSFISIVVGNNVSRQTKVVDSASTLRSVLEEAGIDYARGGNIIPVRVRSRPPI